MTVSSIKGLAVGDTVQPSGYSPSSKPGKVTSIRVARDQYYYAEITYPPEWTCPTNPYLATAPTPAATPTNPNPLWHQLRRTGRPSRRGTEGPGLCDLVEQCRFLGGAEVHPAPGKSLCRFSRPRGGQLEMLLLLGRLRRLHGMGRRRCELEFELEPERSRWDQSRGQRRHGLLDHQHPGPRRRRG